MRRDRNCFPERQSHRSSSLFFWGEDTFSLAEGSTVMSGAPGSGRDTEIARHDLLEGIGRGEWIRTTGLLVPNQALYQAEPRPEKYGFSWCEISRKVRKIFPPLEDHKQNPQVNFQSSADDPESIVG